MKHWVNRLRVYSPSPDIAQRRAFSAEARPMSPLWNDIAIILGEEIHDFLGVIKAKHRRSYRPSSVRINC